MSGRPEHARFGIPRLRVHGHATDLNEAEPDAGPPTKSFSTFVHACGKAESVWEIQAPHLNGLAILWPIEQTKHGSSRCRRGGNPEHPQGPTMRSLTGLEALNCPQDGTVGPTHEQPRPLASFKPYGLVVVICAQMTCDGRRSGGCTAHSAHAEGGHGRQ